jgi:recombination protein RecR
VFSPSVQKLIDELSKLPGIGPKTAQRLTFHLLKLPPEDALPLAHALIEVKETVRFCTRCFNLAEGELCEICADPTRDQRTICVVEEPADVISIERTHEYRGLYHVLGGALSPIDGVGPQKLRLAELSERVRSGEVQEVIVATNPNMAGEATALYIAEDLRPLVAAGTLRITRPAAGLPMGGDLEYADEVTLSRALAGRREIG